MDRMIREPPGSANPWVVGSGHGARERSRGLSPAPRTGWLPARTAASSAKRTLPTGRLFRLFL